MGFNLESLQEAFTNIFDKIGDALGSIGIGNGQSGGGLFSGIFDGGTINSGHTASSVMTPPFNPYEQGGAAYSPSIHPAPGLVKPGAGLRGAGIDATPNISGPFNRTAGSNIMEQVGRQLNQQAQMDFLNRRMTNLKSMNNSPSCF